MNFKRFNGSTWETMRHKIYGSGTDSLTAFPAMIQASGEPLTDYLITGNTVQNGTPSPEAPVDVNGVGVRTANVMPAGEQKTVVSNGVTFSSDGNGRYHISGTATAEASVRFNLLSAFATPISVAKGGQGTLSFFNTQSCYEIIFAFCNGTTVVDDWSLAPLIRTHDAYNTLGDKYVDNVVITVKKWITANMTTTPEFTNDGIIPSKFEPYGYKLPLTVNGTEYPIYLGQVPTTRKIKKLVLDGTENWTYRKGDPANVFFMYLPTAKTGEVAMSNAYPYYSGTDFVDMNDKGFSIIRSNLAIRNSDYQYESQFKAYIAAQYAAGTPVTVWYVLAEPETGIVNEPLHKIGGYTDTITMAQAGVTIPTSDGDNTISFGTTVQPSAMSATFKGWHPVQGAKQYDGSEWR